MKILSSSPKLYLTHLDSVEIKRSVSVMKLRCISLVVVLIAFVVSVSCNKKPLSDSSLPNVELKTLSGQSVHLSDYKGKPLLVNFWATWCGPCRLEIPMLNELHRKYGKDLVILGISTDDEGAEAVREFNKEVPIEYLSLLKTDAVDQKFGGIWALPTSIFYDKQGKEIEKIIGLQTREVFEQNIEKAIKSE